MSDENDQHYWSGWPGAYCFKCGAEDPFENALGDGLWVPHQSGFNEVTQQYDYDGIDWLGTPEQREQLEKANICPIKGKLIWNDILRKFELAGPDSGQPFFIDMRQQEKPNG